MKRERSDSMEKISGTESITEILGEADEVVKKVEEGNEAEQVKRLKKDTYTWRALHKIRMDPDTKVLVRTYANVKVPRDTIFEPEHACAQCEGTRFSDTCIKTKHCNKCKRCLATCMCLDKFKQHKCHDCSRLRCTCDYCDYCGCHWGDGCSGFCPTEQE